MATRPSRRLPSDPRAEPLPDSPAGHDREAVRVGKDNPLSSGDVPDGGNRGARKPRTLAEKLQTLIETMHPYGKRLPSNDELAAAITQHNAAKGSSDTISGGYIWLLRNGQRDNPTKRHLEMLADYFGVPPAYFFDDVQAAAIDDQLKMLALFRDSGIRAVAARMSGLKPETLQAVHSIIEEFRRVQGLKDLDA